MKTKAMDEGKEEERQLGPMSESQSNPRLFDFFPSLSLSFFPWEPSK